MTRAGPLSEADIDVMNKITASPDARYVPNPIGSAWGTRPA